MLPARQPPFFKKKRHPQQKKRRPKASPPTLHGAVAAPYLSFQSPGAEAGGKSRRGGRVVPSWDPAMTALKALGSHTPFALTHPPSPRARPRGEAALPAARFAPSGCLPAPRRGCAIPPRLRATPGGQRPRRRLPGGQPRFFSSFPFPKAPVLAPSAPPPVPLSVLPSRGLALREAIAFCSSSRPPPPPPRLPRGPAEVGLLLTGAPNIHVFLGAFGAVSRLMGSLILSAPWVNQAGGRADDFGLKVGCGVVGWGCYETGLRCARSSTK